jgi:hypothetical protein
VKKEGRVQWLKSLINIILGKKQIEFLEMKSSVSQISSKLFTTLYLIEDRILGLKKKIDVLEHAMKIEEKD